jgi:prepilin-type N-terminal cleavage/methylation domain-containing protein
MIRRGIFTHIPKRVAFTLIELLVVISIIGLISTVAVVALGSAQINSRNTTRKTNLVQISKALEVYYASQGGYPDTGGAWRGDCSTFNSWPDVDTLNASPTSCLDLSSPSWIPGLTSCGYMVKLPHDPNTNKSPGSGSSYCLDNPGASCYLYKSDGTDYKLLAHCTPEGGNVSTTDPFYDNGHGRSWAYAVYSSGGYGW